MLLYQPVARGMTMRNHLVAVVLLTVGVAAPVRSQQQLSGAPGVTLRIDPQLIAEAAEVWSVIATPRNTIWPGWNAAKTPLLFYVPGVQDVLLNHPRPPADFRPYGGPVRFPGAQIWVRDGPTFELQPGQNTSRDVAGTRTLVVDGTPSATSPYQQMMLMAHEAFHVFQDTLASSRSPNEMLLLRYPVLSITNNVGLAQEGTALAAALQTADAGEFRAAALRWLAVRRGRRAALPPQAVAYEDGVEFSEGLAKYAEFRLLDGLAGRRPGPQLWWVPGFHGYGDLSAERAALLAMLLRHMRGEVVVNDDPFGTAPARLRLYFSGMAVAAVLDRLSPSWKARILSEDMSLTDLVADALGANDEALARSLEQAHREPEFDSLVAAKTRLAERGRAHVDSLVTAIERGPGTGVVVDYGTLADPRVGMNFTPFGITVVDSVRTVFAQVPIGARLSNGAEIAQRVALPLLRDTGRRLLRFRLSRDLSAEEWERVLAADTAAMVLDLPEVRVTANRAAVARDGRDIRIVLR